jgi:multidrug efflux pump subunit AcrB
MNVPANPRVAQSTRPHDRAKSPIARPKRPDSIFNFHPPSISSQILDFGLPAPIDVQVVGVDRAGNLELAKKLRQKMAAIPGIADVHIHQITDYPTLHVDVDRIKASEIGLTQQNATNSVLVSLSGTSQVTPNYWVNPGNRVNYVLAVQTPPYRIPSLDTSSAHRLSMALLQARQFHRQRIYR